MTSCTHGLRGQADPCCARCSTAGGDGLRFQAARLDVAARGWTRTRRTATTMGLPGRVAWTAFVVVPGVLGLDLMLVNRVPFFGLGPFWTIVSGALVLPDVWARGRL